MKGDPAGFELTEWIGSSWFHSDVGNVSKWFDVGLTARGYFDAAKEAIAKAENPAAFLPI